MKVALVILHADPSRGGAETYTVNLARALRDRGHEVAILASTAAPGVVATLLDAPGWTRTARYRTFLDSLDRHLEQARYEMVHAMLPMRKCDLYHPHSGMAAEALEQWSVLFNPRRRLMAATEKQLLSSPAQPGVLVLSDYVKSAVRKHFALPENRLIRLFNAVDLDRFEPVTREPSSQCNALIVAQDYARKGLRQAMEAVSRIDDPRLTLTVVGKQDPTDYRRLAALWGIESRVRFAGPQADIRPFYRDADLFVLPTRHDPCSLVVLEALAMGLPVISTRFNGACEIMTDGTHGFVLPDPDDIDALTRAMRKLLDPQLRAEMSDACLQLRPQLSYVLHVDRLVSIYQSRREQSG